MAHKELGPNKALFLVFGVFLAAYFIPFDSLRVSRALVEAFSMLGEYARDHVLLCLVPAMFIAGAITVFLNQRAVIRYLGPRAPKLVAYGVAAVSGAILAVCSCTVLPLFKGIYKKGAGLGPAVSFLYSGPAVNILAIVLSYKIFGWQIGVARMIGAVLFSILIGMIMQMLFRKEDEERLSDERMFRYDGGKEGRTLGQMIVYMISMIGILVFVNWASSKGGSTAWDLIFRYKYLITAAFALLLLFSLVRWFSKEDIRIWGIATRDFSLQILPYLFGGVLIAGFLLGRPGHDALIPTKWVASLVGGNSLSSNLIAAVSGAFMYFATLTEVPIVQGLLGSGMGQGPALALLLAGPSLSLPSMLVIGGELGAKKTLVYVLLVVVLSTTAGLLFGIVTA
ncbi:permease [Sediminispirochaeta smaragdinae]|uniref:Permease n=1 Tax=Sediminispirochaeta smaragdinae (strain DSM 11293 / JCM 15392 / SEBR 4228) TaxID=573413 RepID=E1R4R5_SEDSS|nr:permease [Sediminispirochaeta smaragdinae]ADK82153.1 permease [Sediminispirochaeta smaragdinae DSM 11293]